MSNGETLTILRDLAVIMIVAGGVIVVFHWLRQPVILGYIIAGFIIGPNSFPFPFVSEVNIINMLAEIGIILLMFSLGLEFSLRKLRRVGMVAVIGGALQVLIVFTLGYQLGMLLGWGATNALFLGACLSISSTALIIKVMEEQRRMGDRASQVVFGILVFEDFAAIALIALLSGLTRGEGLQVSSLTPILSKFLLFAAISLFAGFTLIPRLMNHVLATGRRELSVVLGLGLCFGFALFANWLGLSVAAGGFVAGALIAEAKKSDFLAHTMAPIRDMFAAVFFVAIGMLLDPALLSRYWPHVLLVTGVLIAGKILAGSVATFLVGYERGTAIRIGMSLAQIGEFSLVLVKIGHDRDLVGPFLYPVIVGAVGLSTLTTPYLINRSASAGEWLDRALSPRLRRYLQTVEAALQRLQSQVGEPGPYRTALRHNIQGILINLFLFFTVAVLGRLTHEHWETIISFLGISSLTMAMLVGVSMLALATFPLVAIIHYVRKLAVIGSEALNSQSNSSPILTRPVVRVLFRNLVTIILLLAMITVVNLLLPTFPRIPYLPWFILGASLLVLIYLFWGILGVLHQRVERLIGKHLDDKLPD